MLGRLMDGLRELVMMRGLDPEVPVLDQDELEEAVESGDQVVVLFYADWCGFCARFMGPFREKHDELPGKVVAANISSNSDPRWDRFRVQAVPTLIAFQGGQPVARADARPGRGLGPEHIDEIADALAG